YNRLIFSGEKVAPHLLHVAPELKDRVISINGASKTYAMTGWRLGWAIGPAQIISVLGDFLSQTTSNASSISQHAAVAALEKGEPELAQTLQNLIGKMQWCLKEFKSLQWLQVVPPEGAFYLWVDVSRLFQRSFN